GGVADAAPSGAVAPVDAVVAGQVVAAPPVRLCRRGGAVVRGLQSIKPHVLRPDRAVPLNQETLVAVVVGLDAAADHHRVSALDARPIPAPTRDVRPPPEPQPAPRYVDRDE